MYESDLLEALDPDQRRAVTHLGSPALVLAGAGSGKTRTITFRVAWLMNVINVPGSSILAVTFTNKAAGEMRERLGKMLAGGKDREGIWVHTFHRACSRLLRIEGKVLGIPPGFTVADYQDQAAIVRKLSQDLANPFPKVGPDAWLARIGKLKDELVRPGDFEPATAEEEWLARLYPAYQAALRRDDLMDFDDLLLEAERLLREHPDVLGRWRERFGHLLVDEFQDTNSVQYLLMRMLAGEGRGLFVVGDEDQSIYRWRGAAPANFRRFREDFGNAGVYLLEHNYRSTPVILQAAGAVIERSFTRTPKKLRPERKGGERILHFVARDAEGEARWVTRRIRGLLASRYAPEQIAVLYRVNAQSPPLEQALSAARIPFRLVGATRFFGRQEVKDLLAYLRLGFNPEDDPSFRRVVNTPPRGIGPAALEALEKEAAAGGFSLHRAALGLAEAGSAPGRKLAPFASLLGELGEAARALPPAALLDRVLEASGYRGWLEGGGLKESGDRLANVRELRKFLKALPERPGEEGLAGFLDEVALLGDADENGGGGVSLMTLHLAKGLEWPVVFLVGLEEGLLPHARALADREEMEEERRLCYVGMTRARDLLFLSNARQRLLWGRPAWNTPSRFLEEVPRSLVEREEEETPGEPDREPAVRKPAPRKGPEEFPAGSRVRHPSFGEGVILAREGSGADLKLVIGFPRHGRRKILARFFTNSGTHT